MKACTKCGEIKDDSAFSVKGRRLASWCKRCCSDAAKDYYYRNRERVLERVAQKRADESEPLPGRQCAECGAGFTPQTKLSNFCSKPCRTKATRRKFKAKVAAQNQARMQSVPVECDVCGTMFRRTSYQQLRCSKQCATEHDKRVAVAYRAARYDPKRLTLEDRECTECGETFSPRDERQMGCSVACGQKRSARISSRKRRAALRGQPAESVDPLEIFDRDGWCCSMCGKSTPKDQRGAAAPDSPELDHVVPLTRGGWHKPDNLRLLCRACNMSKGARLDSEWKGKAAPTLALF